MSTTAGSAADQRDRALAISECHRYLAEVSYWRNDLVRMVHAMLASLNHAEPAGDSKEGVVAFASVGFLFGLVQLHRVARHYRRLTDEASARVGNPDAAGYAAELEGVYHLVVADWASTHRIAERGVAIFREIGDRMRWHTCHSHIGYAWLHQGRFDLAGANAREAVVALGPEGLLQSRLWSLSAVLACDLAQDRLDPGLIAELDGLLGPAVHDADQLLVRGLVAKALERAGDDDAALATRSASRRSSTGSRRHRSTRCSASRAPRRSSSVAGRPPRPIAPGVARRATRSPGSAGSRGSTTPPDRASPCSMGRPIGSRRRRARPAVVAAGAGDRDAARHAVRGGARGHRARGELPGGQRGPDHGRDTGARRPRAERRLVRRRARQGPARGAEGSGEGVSAG